MTSDLEDRYSRQVLFAGVGSAGQERLAASRVLLVGCGGLGSTSAELLVRAGVGLLRIVDRDVVELSNLQRQALFDEEDVRLARPKAVAAARRLRQVNSAVVVEGRVVDLGPGNISRLLDGIDLVVDGLDNFEGRYLINDACVARGVPWVYGSCVMAQGVAALLVPGVTPCLRCLNPDAPEPGSSPTCDTVGVIGPIAHLTASVQAGLALKLLATGEAPRAARLLTFDAWGGSCDQVEVARDPANDCPCCGQRRFDYLNATAQPAVAQCGGSVLVRPPRPGKPGLAALAARLRPLGEVMANRFLVRFRVGGHELTLFADGRAVVKGTDSVELARSLVARYFGS